MAAPDDPRIAELLGRRNGTATIARTPPQVRCRKCHLSYDANEPACTFCGHDPTAPPEPASPQSPRVRKPTPSPPQQKCGKCGGRINTFAGKCPRCDTVAPTTLDAKPVKRLTVADLPTVTLTPEPAAEPEPAQVQQPQQVQQVQPEPAAPAEPAPDPEPADDQAEGDDQAEDLCWCGRPNRHSGRHAGQKQGDAVAGITAPSLETVREMKQAVRAVTPIVDPEAAAIDAVVAALGPLCPAARARVLAYIDSRFDPEAES